MSKENTDDKLRIELEKLLNDLDHAMGSESWNFISPNPNITWEEIPVSHGTENRTPDWLDLKIEEEEIQLRTNRSISRREKEKREKEKKERTEVSE